MDGTLDSNLFVSSSDCTKCSAILINKNFEAKIDIIPVVTGLKLVGIRISLDGARWTSIFSLHFPSGHTETEERVADQLMERIALHKRKYKRDTVIVGADLNCCLGKEELGCTVMGQYAWGCRDAR